MRTENSWRRRPLPLRKNVSVLLWYNTGMFEEITHTDMAILHGIHDSLASPVMDSAMSFVTTLGDIGFIWFVIAATAICLKKHRLYGIAIIVAIILAFMVGDMGLKHLFERPRPFLADPSLATELIELPTSFSFPSGHTSSSFAAATVLCLTPFAHRWFKPAAVLGAVAIAFSRLYLCVHYPSDVCAGAILGIACGFAAVAITKAFFSWREKRSARLEKTS